MSLVDDIKRARERKFPDYAAAQARVDRAAAKVREAQAELSAAREGVAKYGDDVRDFDLAIQLIEEQLGEEA